MNGCTKETDKAKSTVSKYDFKYLVLCLKFKAFIPKMQMLLALKNFTEKQTKLFSTSFCMIQHF